MKGRLTIISVDGAVSSKELAAPPALEDLQGGVGGGYIEVVPYFTRYEGKRCVAFCNEHGKLHLHLPMNVAATQVWYLQEPRAIGRDYLVGDIVIVTGDRALMEEL